MEGERKGEKERWRERKRDRDGCERGERVCVYLD